MLNVFKFAPSHAPVDDSHHS